MLMRVSHCDLRIVISYALFDYHETYSSRTPHFYLIVGLISFLKLKRCKCVLTYLQYHIHSISSAKMSVLYLKLFM